MCVMTWEPIAELGDWQDLASKELPPLTSVWEEQRQTLDSTALSEFKVRLVREWSIETGILERLYTIDRGITQLLIERGFDSSIIPHDDFNGTPENVVAYLKDHQEAMEWLFEVVKSDRPFSESFIKELHSLIVRNQKTATGRDPSGRPVEIPLRRGEYKLRSNNPTRPDGVVHEYCPPEQVTVEMERLLSLYHHYQTSVPPEVISAWLHHRFVQIHPFQDGNGRVARAISSLVFIQAGWFPLMVDRDQRSEYLDALEAADQGNISILVRMFATAQRKAFVNALGIAHNVRRASERLEQMYEVIGDQFQQRDQSLADDMDNAKTNAVALWEDAGVQFQKSSDNLSTKINISSYRNVYHDEGSPSDTSRRYWHRWQIIESAKEIGYFASIAEFAAWQRIVLKTERGRSEILLSFHAVGREYRGIISSIMVFYRKAEMNGGHYDHHTVSKENFQINYLEGLDDVRTRFRAWLDEHLLQALEIWRQGE